MNFIWYIYKRMQYLFFDMLLKEIAQTENIQSKYVNQNCCVISIAQKSVITSPVFQIISALNLLIRNKSKVIPE